MAGRLFLKSLTAYLLVPVAMGASQQPDFSGKWKQDGERCTPVRKGNVARRIEQHGSNLTVETTILRVSGPPRLAVQRYTLDGTVSTSTGADGDDFHTSAVWSGQRLVFFIEEHEDGRVLHSRETWALVDNGSVLRVERQVLDESGNADQKQTLIYLRQPTAPDSR